MAKKRDGCRGLEPREKTRRMASRRAQIGWQSWSTAVALAIALAGDTSSSEEQAGRRHAGRGLEESPDAQLVVQEGIGSSRLGGAFAFALRIQICAALSLVRLAVNGSLSSAAS